MSKWQSSFVGLGMIGFARPETTVVPDNMATLGINETKRVDWDLRRYGMGIQKTWPVKKLKAFPYFRWGWQASFTVVDGSMDYRGEEVASVNGQALAASLLTGLEYPFSGVVSLRLLGSLGVEGGRFATVLNGLGDIPDKCFVVSGGLPTTVQVVDAASCELANMLATYYSFPTMLTGGLKLFDTLHLDLSWQRQYIHNSPYVYSPDDLNTFWFTAGIDTD
ncbi:MAG: hypothetical protein HYY44_09585 [Deltaproteobacteria bacterium]|nr:hypothetical protein [Deltaproteobacteria bacterium]MBI4373275.1 hypothetical protein [Deltaproteobacteria bacterium]